ncbi:fatty acid desaturase family protein [Demetria terragena]|uniref:fatty acid desaturase family protein n=1 Tax=Demetria terragena TaxID=63959 RepID=UPI000377035E|nr:acyl-CoA desaturase [Demetria terragena]
MTLTDAPPASATDPVVDTSLRRGSKPSVTQRTGVLPAAGSPAVRPPGADHLSDEEVRQLGAELDAIRDEVIASRGAKDAAYIKRMVKITRGLEVGGRAMLLASRYRPAWALGTGMLALGKVLDNMEVGHNTLHGQWDWMRDPDIHSTTYEWDFVAPARGWQHTHNDLHHTWTNVIGKDRDVGYNILRVDEDQPWARRDLFNPLVNAGLALVFEWGIASYDLEWDQVQEGHKTKEAFDADVRLLKTKAIKQITKEYIAFPVVAQVVAKSGTGALTGSVAANAIRNVWAHSVIFCGHFPEGVETFTEDMIEGESRGDWYVRQMMGSANLSGSKLFHILTGNLSHQIEHHCFPDIPSNRYFEIAPRVRQICERYGLPYTTGPLPKQLASTWKRIIQLSLPDGARWRDARRLWRENAPQAL